MVFYPRVADVKRGWGKFHNKSCKARVQEARTGQYAEYLNRQADRDCDPGDDMYWGHKD